MPAFQTLRTDICTKMYECGDRFTEDVKFKCRPKTGIPARAQKGEKEQSGGELGTVADCEAERYMYCGEREGRISTRQAKRTTPTD